MVFSPHKPSFLIKVQKKIKTEFIYSEYSLEQIANS